MQNSLNELQFFMRSKWLGKLSLRRGLPEPSVSELILKEREYYQLLLKAVFSPLSSHSQGLQPDEMSAVYDVGCRNWSYAPALAAFFPQAQLIGIEVDAARRYWNLYRRGDLARAYAHELSQQGRKALFWEGDFREYQEGPKELPSDRPVDSEASLFCFFFPFVSENPCLKWGLPTRFVSFSELLLHAQRVAQAQRSQRASCISSHQGEWEAEEARRSYIAAGLPFEEVVVEQKHTAPFWPSHFDTHVLYSVPSLSPQKRESRP